MATYHRLAGRIGGLTCYVRHGGRAMTAAANAANATRWEREADPQGLLPPAERARRGEALKKAWFARLGLKSAQARRKRSPGRLFP